MKSIKSILTPFLTPFYYADKKTYTIIFVLWIAIFAGLWQGAPALWPTPMEILTQLQNFVTSKDFYYDVMASLALTTKSMAISIVIASILSYLYVTPLFKPIVQFIVKLRFMSLLGFLFVFMSLLHDADKVKTALLTFSIVPFFTLSLVSMINRIPQKEFDLWTTLKYSKWEQLFEVIIYGKADYVIEAIATNFAMGWLVMTVAESKSMAEGGLGVLLFKYDKYNQLDKIFALQIIIFFLGIFFDYTLKNLRYKIFPYTALVEKH